MLIDVSGALAALLVRVKIIAPMTLAATSAPATIRSIRSVRSFDVFVFLELFIEGL